MRKENFLLTLTLYPSESMQHFLFNNLFRLLKRFISILCTWIVRFGITGIF